jgi:hypothetical protein
MTGEPSTVSRVVRRRWRPITIGWQTLAATIAGVFALELTTLEPAGAQYVNNVCGWGQGRCPVNPAPVGSGCGCVTNLGVMEGRILPPSGYGEAAMSNVCRTYRGVCQVYPQSVGAACYCYGDAGVITPR